MAAYCLEQIDRGIQPILNRQYVGVLHVQGVALGLQARSIGNAHELDEFEMQFVEAGPQLGTPDEFEATVRSLSGDADLRVSGPRSGFDEALYPALARHADVAIASPVVELDHRPPELADKAQRDLLPRL